MSFANINWPQKIAQSWQKSRRNFRMPTRGFTSDLQSLVKVQGQILVVAAWVTFLIKLPTGGCFQLQLLWPKCRWPQGGASAIPCFLIGISTQKIQQQGFNMSLESGPNVTQNNWWRDVPASFPRSLSSLWTAGPPENIIKLKSWKLCGFTVPCISLPWSRRDEGLCRTYTENHLINTHFPLPQSGPPWT